MSEMIIKAVYEEGVLRPLRPLRLVENQTVNIQILPEDEERDILNQLIASGLVTPPPGTQDAPPLTEPERLALANRLGKLTDPPLSQRIIAERDER